MCKKKVKVLNIITRLDRGGSAESVIHIVSQISGDSYENTLVSGRTKDPDGSVGRDIRENNINVVFLPRLIREISVFNDIAAFLWLFRFIKKNRFDIVHTHTSKAGVLGRWAAFYAGTRVIIHSPHGHIFYGYYGVFRSWLFRMIEKATVLVTDKMIILTPRGICEHVSLGIGPVEKFVSVHSGVEIVDFLSPNSDSEKLKIKMGIPKGSFVIGTVTRLEKVKDNATLIKAFAYLNRTRKDALLVIVGEGSLRAGLEKLCKKLGVTERVRFLGLRGDVPEMIDMFDVFALASVNEGMGKVFIQAAVLEKPVVATDVGGIADVVLNGKTGLLVPASSPEKMGEAFVRLIEDRDFAKSLGKAGREWVSGLEDGEMRYSVRLMIKKIKRLYDELSASILE